MTGVNLRNIGFGAGLALAIVALIVGINALSTPSAPSEEVIQATVAAAVSTVQQANMRQSPILLTPSDSTVFENAAAVNLQWRWFRPLEEDEYFDLSIWREGEPPDGITWTKDEKLDLREWLLYQEPGDYLWSVAVVRGGSEEEEPVVLLSDPAPPQRFTMNTIDMQVMDLPPGFTASYYARLPFKQPSAITFGPDGALYALSVEGNIARISDIDDDNFAEIVETIYTDAENLLDHAVGMAFYKDTLYISDAGRISTITDTDDDGILDTITPIIENLPSLWYTFHSNNGIAFYDDALYIAVGSTTDHGPLQTPLEASILRAKPDGSDLEVFATGFRNPYDLVFMPNGDLFTADNSPDGLNETLAYLPPEELNYVRQGGNYGFPDQYGFPDSASETLPPVTELLTSSASSGLTYVDSDTFPPEYHGIYLAQFGTGADIPVSAGVKTGRQVVFISLTPDGNGGYTGTWKPFAVFRTDLQDSYTPINLTIGEDGALYIVEWTSATIYRVTYDADRLDSASEMSLINVGKKLYYEGVADAPACLSCHQLSSGAGIVAPSLIGIAETARTRQPSMSAEDYLRQSILEPDAYIVSGYSGGLMYQHYAEKLTEEQIDALIRYLLKL